MKRTSSPPQIDGRAGGAPQWRHRRDYKARVDTTKGYTPSGAFVVHRETISGTDLDTGEPVDRVILTLSNGETIVADYDANGDEMSRSNRFTPKRAKSEFKFARMYDTDLETGLVTEFYRVTPVTTEVDGTMTYGPAFDKTPDMLADYVVAGHVDKVPALVRISTANEPVTGSTPYALTAPAQAAYGEIYIEGSNIRWTQDASTPAPGNGEQDRAGTTVKLYGTSALTGFRALPIDNVGNIDPALQSDLTVTFWNLNPERGPYSMTVPTVAALIFSYVEGTDPANPNTGTVTFSFSGAVTGPTSNQIVDIGSWGPAAGDDYASLPTQMMFDLSTIGISSLSDPIESTVFSTWRFHMPGTASDGSFYRFQADIASGTAISFATVSEFATWLMDQLVDSVGVGTITNANDLVDISMVDGVLIFDTAAYSMQWDSSGSTAAYQRRLLHPVVTYTPGTVTNNGVSVPGTWSAVGGDATQMRFTPSNPGALDYNYPLLFDFSAITVVDGYGYRDGAATTYSLPITNVVPAPPADFLRFTPQPIVGGDTQLVIDVFYSDWSTTMSSLGDPVISTPNSNPIWFSIPQAGSWSVSGDQIIFTFDSPVTSGANLFVNYSGVTTAGGSTGDGSQENIIVG